jgi:Fe-S cluster biosynthesis and repair protein YggX
MGLKIKKIHKMKKTMMINEKRLRMILSSLIFAFLEIELRDRKVLPS